MTRRFLFLPVFAAAFVAVACGGSTATQESKSPGSDAGVDVRGTCNGAVVIPPVVTVVDSQTGEQLCGASIQALSDAGYGTGSNLGTPCTASTQGCPSHAGDGGSLACILSVEGGGGTTVTVTASGYGQKSVDLPSVVDGCSGGVSGSNAITVMLDPATPTCGAIGLVPPTLVARDAVTGALICDPSVTTAGDAGGMTYVDSCAPMTGGGTFGGCPTTPPDGGTLACVFVLFFGGSVSPPAETITVSAPGYAPKVVTGVMSGVTGCVSNPTAGSQVEVSLTPVSEDAGADAGTGDAAHD